MKVLKRDGRVLNFDRLYIQRAIEGAMRETKANVNVALSDELTTKVVDLLMETNSVEAVVNIESIQDAVEDILYKNASKELYTKFAIYRHEQANERRIKKPKDLGRLLSDDFISKYKHLLSPMTEMGDFVYYRTYSRYLPESGRREYWWETVRRAVEYNCSIVKNVTRKEAEELFDNIFNLRQFLSGRTFWVGGTAVSNDYAMGNFNCAFQVMSTIDSFWELFYILMVGSGAGVRVLKKDVAKLPKFRTNIDLNHNFTAVEKHLRQELTSVEYYFNFAKIVVGDSKEGWKQALKTYFEIITGTDYKYITQIIIDYSNVRPKGEPLKKFGGTASGHESLKQMFIKIDDVVKRAGKRNAEVRAQLRPIDVLDISNIIAENVVSGGVRRSAEIALIDADDEECINAKANLYTQVNGDWIPNKDLLHRNMSNNSIYYTSKPTRERLKWQLEKMRFSGEPGWINEEEGKRRFPNMKGVNPCGEILLDNKGMCNLTTLNVFSFVDQNGDLDIPALLRAQRLSVRASYRLTEVEMELISWDNVLQENKIVGCSLTGWQDMVNLTGISREEEIELLKQLRQVAHAEGDKYAEELGRNKPVLVTTVKPEGTLSQLPTVSSGVHYSHSPYYVRRVRISANDPLLKAVYELGWIVKPENGQTMENASTMVVEFPVKAPAGKTKYDVSAIEQLENYKMFMEHYVDHNASITISVRENEWDDVEEWVWNNWDGIVGLSFLALEDSFYELLPYESIDEAEYLKRKSEMAKFVPSLISKYEDKAGEYELEASCDTGACPTR